MYIFPASFILRGFLYLTICLLCLFYINDKDRQLKMKKDINLLEGLWRTSANVIP